MNLPAMSGVISPFKGQATLELIRELVQDSRFHSGFSFPVFQFSGIHFFHQYWFPSEEGMLDFASAMRPGLFFSSHSIGFLPSLIYDVQHPISWVIGRQSIFTQLEHGVFAGWYDLALFPYIQAYPNIHNGHRLTRCSSAVSSQWPMNWTRH